MIFVGLALTWLGLMLLLGASLNSNVPRKEQVWTIFGSLVCTAGGVYVLAEVAL